MYCPGPVSTACTLTVRSTQAREAPCGTAGASVPQLDASNVLYTVTELGFQVRAAEPVRYSPAARE